jgi:glucuronokinase
VGLSGSSAIVIAALRALGDWLGFELPPDQLAEAALACEVDELGITAGPMDRVIQAYEGLLAMDFAPPRAAASYRRLDPSGLPPLFLAWNPRGGAPSRRQHGDVRARWLRGDTEVREVVAAALADSRRCISAAISPDSRPCSTNFALRARASTRSGSIASWHWRAGRRRRQDVRLRRRGDRRCATTRTGRGSRSLCRRRLRRAARAHRLPAPGGGV